MRYFVLIFTLFLVPMTATQSSASVYYYGNDQQMLLGESSSQIAIRRDTLPPIQDWDTFLAQVTQINPSVDPTPGFLGYDIYTLNAGADVDSLLAGC